MDVLFIAGFSPIATDVQAAHGFYRDSLGLPLETISGDYIAVEGFDGAKHFGVWPIGQAAESCFGISTWPDHLPVPHATIEFEVADVAEAAAELQAAGHTMIHEARVEPWGQEIARFMGPEGLLVGLCSTPGLQAE